jgi:hemerythrin superfamily protein
MADVLDLLLAQHARIEELFGAVMHADGELRRQRFEELVRLLAVHETAEEEVVHPRGRTAGGVEDAVIDERLAEEQDAKRQLAQLADMGADHPDFEPRLLALREAVLTHAKREERYEFPQLAKSLEPGERERLGMLLLTAERFAPARPHPGVESATANLLAGPLLAVGDRVRDAIRNAMR